MTTTCDWLAIDNTLWMTFSGSVTIRELVDLTAEVQAFGQNTPAPVTCVIDVRDVKRFPQQLGELALAYDFGTPAVFSDVIFVGLTNTLMRFLATSVMHIYHLPYTHVNTPEDALRVLDARRTPRYATAGAGALGAAQARSSSQMTS